MAIAVLVRKVSSMAEQVKKIFHCFPRADFHVAAAEMLRLYLPGAQPGKLTEEECRSWYQRPAAGDVLICGSVRQAGEAIDCTASLHCLHNGHLRSTQQTRRVELLPWENKTGAERRGIRLLVKALLQDFFQAQAGPWGILCGVRPTKPVHRLLDTGQSPSAVRKLLCKAYDVRGDKAALVTNIAVRQRPFLPDRNEARRLISVYVGIPFCPSRCAYCAFPSFPIGGAGQQVGKFLAALRREIEAVERFLTRHNLEVQNLYVGGGTPTSLPNREFRQLLTDVRQAFHSKTLREFTLEAGRPDTLTPDKLALMREQGVDRISINPQTMREHTLQAIGRSHGPADVDRVFRLARETGFQNINMDLIAGLPGETPEDMSYTLARIGELQPENLTIHTLAIKRGSHLKESGGYRLPQGGAVEDMLKLCAAAAQSWRLIPYYLYRQKYMAGNLENVGYALPGKECLYNIQIMEEHQTILGLGAAAATKAVDHGDWKVMSCYNPKDISTYIHDLQIYLERKLALVQRALVSKEEESLC